MAVTPNSLVTTQGVRTAVAIATAAKTSPFNTITNAVLLATAGSNGTLVKKLKASPRGTIAAYAAQLYLSRDGGTTLSLVKVVAGAAYTASTSAAVTEADFGYTAADPLRLGSGDSLYVASAVALADGVQFYAELEDF